MYCPHCGTESTQGLNYCKRCGGSLNVLAPGAAQESQPAVSTGKVWAVGTTTLLLIVLGLGVMFAALGEQIAAWFVESKSAEWEAYRQQVHAWELERYLPIF